MMNSAGWDPMTRISMTMTKMRKRVYVFVFVFYSFSVDRFTTYRNRVTTTFRAPPNVAGHLPRKPETTTSILRNVNSSECALKEWQGVHACKSSFSLILPWSYLPTYYQHARFNSFTSCIY